MKQCPGYRVMIEDGSRRGCSKFLRRFHSNSMMNVGAEWMIDASGCSAKRLADLQTLKKVCEEIINDLDLHVVGQPMWHQFPSPGGVTGLFLLTESHLACHTYPETGIATFNLYCCNVRPEWQWQGRLRELLGATSVIVRFAERGDGAQEASLSQREDATERAAERERGA